MKVSMEHHRVRQTLGGYDSLHARHAHVAVTSWANGEGWDVEINENGVEAHFQLTLDGWLALRRTMCAHMRGEAAQP
jgi:hypothetical protein